MIREIIMILFSRLSLLVKRLTRRVRRLLCPIAQSSKYDEKEELMEAGLMTHDNITSNHRNGCIEKELRVPSIQMSPIDALRRTSHKLVNGTSQVVEPMQGDVMLDASAVKDNIRYLLASKYGIDRQKLAVIIGMQKEHKDNGLEGPVLIDPVRLV